MGTVATLMGFRIDEVRLSMPSDPFTIRIFVPDGDPEGVLSPPAASRQLATSVAYTRIHSRQRVATTLGPHHTRDGCGMTDHVWTISELLSYRVHVDFLNQLHDI